MKLESAEEFRWTQHRFRGGRLVLDLCNTVILRHDPARTLDRLAVCEQLNAFPAAVAEMSAEKWDIDALFGAQGNVIELREAADAYFRGLAKRQSDDALLAELLSECASALRGTSGLARTAARSTLRLLADNQANHIKICGFCGWLFEDRSRNHTRLWCDMAVCGNRTKARRQYAKKKIT
jgi:predicted RNA-binding Zn ribbon-like protein